MSTLTIYRVDVFKRQRASRSDSETAIWKRQGGILREI